MLPSTSIEINTEMSVRAYYGSILAYVERITKVSGLCVLVEEFTKVCSDSRGDLEYLRQCLYDYSVKVKDMTAKDRQRALVLHWTGYIYSLLYNKYELAKQFPYQATMGPTEHDIATLRYHVEELRKLHCASQTVPEPPELKRQINTISVVNGKHVNQNKRQRREESSTVAEPFTGVETTPEPRRSRRLAQKQTRSTDDVACGC